MKRIKEFSEEELRGYIEEYKDIAFQGSGWFNFAISGRRRRFVCGTALSVKQDLKEYYSKIGILESPQGSQGTQVIPKTVLACADCICRSELNGDWLPASHLIERIEHTYGLEVN